MLIGSLDYDLWKGSSRGKRCDYWSMIQNMRIEGRGCKGMGEGGRPFLYNIPSILTSQCTCTDPIENNLATKVH